MGNPDFNEREYIDAASRYLRLADGPLRDRIVGFYVVGSAALGQYRPGYSDVDFLAVVDRSLSAVELRRLRGIHLRAAGANALAAVSRGRSPLSGTCNGVYVLADELSRPVADIVPLASHTAQEFHVGEGFDVNPVMWKVLRDGGISLRGPEPAALDLHLDRDGLTAWNLENLETYWGPWAAQVRRGPGPLLRLRARWWTAWGVLGAPRLHYTIATGEVASKEAAGEYALATFASQWHPIIREGLAFRRGQPLDRSLGTVAGRLRRAAEFVRHVVDSAHVL